MAWKETDKHFINPYNFVDYGDEVIRKKPEKGTHSGVLHCSLVTKTPLLIPDHERKREDTREKGHFIYDFFRVNNKAVIPGSELRGTIRSAFEALSDSCFSVNNNNILSSRHSSPRLPGILKYEKGSWHLYEAAMTKIKNNGMKPSEHDIVRTWPSIGQNEPNKSFIISPAGKEVKVEGLEDAINDYTEVINIYIANNPKLSPLYNTVKPNKGISTPLFYEFVTGKNGEKTVYLSPAQISRSVYHNKLNDLLKSYKACDDPEFLCPACSLFGMVSNSSKRGARASQLRFCDAVSEDAKFLDHCTLKELSSPKITSTEFYTKRPKGALFWSYDYKVTGYVGTGKKAQPEREPCDVEIRGRKFYLHSARPEYKDNNRTNRNITAELVDSNSHFSFDIFYDNITQEQLEMLIWTLTLGENSEDSRLWHKTGGGKPIGLGSIKITITGTEERTFDTDTYAYTVTPVSIEVTECPFSGKGLRDFLIICNADTAGKTSISYPMANDGKGKKNSTASHQWFIANRESGSEKGQKGTGTAPIIKYTLPMITDNDLSLPEMVKTGSDNTRWEKHNKHDNSRKSYEPRVYKYGAKEEPAKSKGVPIKCEKCGVTNNYIKQFMNIKQKIDYVCPSCKHKMKVTI